MRLALALSALTCLATAPAMAITPVMACDDVIETGVAVRDMLVLDTLTRGTGVVIEAYGNAEVFENGTRVSRPPPVPELAGFQGARAMSCGTGEFVAIDGSGAGEVQDGLAASELLRAQVEVGQPVQFAELGQAAESIRGPVLVLRETNQTCACKMFFDELRHDRQTPFAERTDVDF